MSTKTPSLQTRSQYNRDWGNYASLAAVPNGSGNALAAPYFAQLEVGDTAYVTGTAEKVVCTAVGTLSGANATWVASGASSSVLWQWNGTDTAQFGSAIDLGLGANIAGITLTTTAGGPNGTLLRVSDTELDVGVVGFPILATLPSRYVIEFEYWAINFSDTTNLGYNAIGIITHGNSTLTSLFSFVSVNITAATEDDQYLSEFAVTAGVPFGPAYILNGSPFARYAQGTPPATTSTGCRIAVTVENQVPCAANPQLAVRVVGSGAHDPTAQQSTDVYGNTGDLPGGAYPAAWNGLTLDTAGILAGNFSGPTTAWNADILSIRILKHPADL